MPYEDLLATIKQLPDDIADMVRVQFLLACRPGEVCKMRWADVDRTPVVVEGEPYWVYTVPHAKTEHHGEETRYPVNEEAQAILSRSRTVDQHAPIFSPARRMAQGRERPQRRFRDCYNHHSYRRIMYRAAKKAGVPQFGPHRIRHLALTMIANDPAGGTGAAASLANHLSRKTTDGYLHRDARLAYRAASILKLG